MAKLLYLGIKKNKYFCFALDFSSLDACVACFTRTLATPKLLTLGNKKKNKFSFCISLVFS